MQTRQVFRVCQKLTSNPIEISDGSVVLSGIEHDKVDKVAEGESAPDSEVVIHCHLTNRHPFKIRYDAVNKLLQCMGHSFH